MTTQAELEHRVRAYESVLHDLEQALYRSATTEELNRLAHRAHNVLCHLEDGCGH